MSDSLRDQLLQAGFNAPKTDTARKKKPRKPRHTKTDPDKRSTQQDADSAIAARKAVKAQIKALIESVAIKEHAGDSVYRFTVQKRIRELHIKEDIRLQLIAGSLVITRLNGTTQLVPAETADQIRALNPNWAIFDTAGSHSVAQSHQADDGADDYADFQVPDDLVW